MAITITRENLSYIFNIVNVQKNAEGVVASAQFNITVSDGTHSLILFYQTGFPKPGNSFIPYTELSEQQIVDWIYEQTTTEGLGKQTDTSVPMFEQYAKLEFESYKSNLAINSGGVPWGS